MEWKEVVADENYNMNCFLKEIDESGQIDIFPEQLKELEKAIPYIGWFWRDLNFTKRFQVGKTTFIGFLSTNIYRYPEWTVSQDERKRTVVMIREMMTAWPNITDEQRTEMLRRFFNLVQGLTENMKV